MKKIPRFTFGMGDRFGKQGEAQLKAVLDARAEGIDVAPVWNKSKREHTLIGTMPESVREEADAAVKALGYDGVYFVDADHITYETVDGFIACSDFFTLDLADKLGCPPASSAKAERYESALAALGELRIDGLDTPMVFDQETSHRIVAQYGGAVDAARQLFDKITQQKDTDQFVIEVSMDETDVSQGAIELMGILRLLALEEVPVQTIAPKFIGRFNKGVDYVGDTEAFRREFEADLIVIRHAVEAFGLPDTLKLSVHSGSDKFSLYSIIHDLVRKHNAGLHLKTAGTTWLEEVIGLAEAGGDALEFVKKLYGGALAHYDELTAPYATVLDIHAEDLASAEEAAGWTGEQVVAMLAHEQDNPMFNAGMRQLFHVAFKLAAGSGSEYDKMLSTHADIVSRCVYNNLFNRHIKKIFPPEGARFLKQTLSVQGLELLPDE